MRLYIRTFFLVNILIFSSASFAKKEELLEGLRYWKVTTALQQSVHVLKVDPSLLSITAAHAKEQALGRETVAAIAKRHKAIAAINGGFFKSGEAIDGLPAGVLKIQSQWYGIAYRSRGAIGWSNQIQTVLMDRIQTKTSVYLNHKKFPVHTVNQPGLVNKTVLYTDTYGPVAGSVQGGNDIVIQNNRILSIMPSGKTKIPKGGYVYAIGPKAKYPNHPIETGNHATVNIEIIPQFLKEHYLAWQLVDNVVGGSPLMIYRGKIVHDHSMERVLSPFISERYARTAVGLLKNGHWIFAVIEQSALTGSPGMSIPELAVFLKELGCEYALNLDGGGSSTLYIDNEIVNHPEGDEDEDYGWAALKPVSDAILILPKKAKS